MPGVPLAEDRALGERPEGVCIKVSTRKDGWLREKGRRITALSEPQLWRLTARQR